MSEVLESHRGDAEVIYNHTHAPFESKDEAFAYATSWLTDQLVTSTSAFNQELKGGNPNADFCAVCQNEFAPSDTVMAKSDKPHEHRMRDRHCRMSTWPKIKCKNKSCGAGLSTSPTASRRIYEVNSLS